MSKKTNIPIADTPTVKHVAISDSLHKEMKQYVFDHGMSMQGLTSLAIKEYMMRRKG